MKKGNMAQKKVPYKSIQLLCQA